MYEVQSAERGWLLQTGQPVIVMGLDTWLRLEVKMALVLALACWRWRGTDTDMTDTDMADTAGNMVIVYGWTCLR